MIRFPFILTGLFVLVGASIASYGVYTLGRARRTAAWPSVPGTITRSQVARGDESFEPDIAFAYNVDGVAHEGREITSGPSIASSTEVAATRRIARYPVGTAVSVSYDPNRPSAALLEPGLTKRSFVPLVFGLMFASFGGSFGLLWWLCEE